MAITNNTLLNTTTVPTTSTTNTSNTNTQTVATSNPQANIASLQANQSATTPTTTTQQATTQTTQNIPTAVEYQPSTTTQNSDMYQSVLDSYQSQYGSSSSTSSLYPQITISDTNDNTIEGQYKSNYSTAINQLAQSILNARFSYNPNEDDLLKEASNYVTQNTLESMNSKGILNSSMTAERVAQVVGKLIPEYEEMAREEFDNRFTQLLNTANLIMDMDDREFEQWQDARDQQYEEKKFEYEQEQDEIENAWQRVDELGYVDNEAALVLGVSAGTLSKDAREAKESYEREVELWQMQNEKEHSDEIELINLKNELEKDTYKYEADIDLANDKELYQYQSDIDLANDKELYQYQSDVDVNKYQKTSDIDLDTYQKEADIDVSKYQKTSDIDLDSSKSLYDYKVSTSDSSSDSSGTSSSSSSTNTMSLSTAEDVLLNRWIEEDSATGKYNVTDNNSAWNYIRSLTESGILSDTNALVLITKYNLQNPNNYTESDSNTTTKTTVQPTLTSDNVETWIKALDGNNEALNTLGVTIFGQYKSNVNNTDAKNAVYEALEQIQNGEYTFTTSQQLMDDLKNGKFGHLGWGL